MMGPKDDTKVRAYRLCFGSPAGREVLNDLMEFCNFNTALAYREGHIDANSILMQEGARQVFLRIINLATLTQEQIIALYGRQHFRLEEEDAA